MTEQLGSNDPTTNMGMIYKTKKGFVIQSYNQKGEIVYWIFLNKLGFNPIYGGQDKQEAIHRLLKEGES